MSISLGTLGTLYVSRDDVPQTSLLTQRQRLAVLLFLAVEHKTTRDEVMAVFWPDRAPEKSRHALSQTLYELKQVLGESWLNVHGEHLEVTDELDIDARRFVQGIECGDHAHALQLYQGEFLKGHYLVDSKAFEQWVDAHRGRLTRLHRTTRRNFINAFVEARSFERAVHEARRWVELDPLEDEAHHRLIDVLVAAGQNGEALKQYRKYEQLLKAEGLEPLPETKQIIDKIHPAASRLPGVTVSELPITQRVPLPTHPEPEHTRKTTRSKWQLAAMITAIIALATAGWWARRPDRVDPLRFQHSIAVVPFLNLTGNSEEEYFADGITEALISALAEVPDVRVAAQTSSFAFKGRNVTAKLIGDSLGVAYILEGNFRRTTNEVMVRAQLVEAGSGFQQWSKTFRRTPALLFEIQDEIARAIARELRVRLNESPVAARAPTANADAYDHYLRGRHFLAKRTADDLRNAATHFRKAIEWDSSFADAWSGLADAVVVSGQLHSTGQQRADAFRDGEAAARRALKLDPNLAEPHASVARAVMNARYGFAEADREFQEAIRLNPSYATAHSWYAQLLVTQGRTGEAEHHARIGQRLDPLSAAANHNAASVLSRTRKFDEAISLAQKAVELSPNLGAAHRVLGDAYLASGKYDDAIASYQKAFDVLTNAQARLLCKAMIVAAYTRAGLRQQAQAAYEAWRQAAAGVQPNETNLAFIHAALGNRDRALGHFRKAIETRQLLPDFIRNLVWQAYQADPEYRRILQRIGLNPDFQD